MDNSSLDSRLATLDSQLADNPNDPRSLAHRGEIQQKMQRYPEALADFDRATELKPDYAWAIARRGEIYFMMKRYPEALADFGRAIELKPDYAWAIAHRGATYRIMGKQYYDLALPDLNRAIELKPDYAWALIHRANIYTIRKRYEEALADVDRALALNDKVIPYWPGERGLLLSYMGRYAEVISCCEAGLKQDPDDFITLYTLAVVKARWQGMDEAAADIQKARCAAETAANTPDRALAIYRLGGLAALEGDSTTALEYLEEAIALDKEPFGLAQNDLAWQELRDNQRFQSLTN